MHFGNVLKHFTQIQWTGKKKQKNTEKSLIYYSLFNSHHHSSSNQLPPSISYIGCERKRECDKAVIVNESKKKKNSSYGIVLNSIFICM